MKMSRTRIALIVLVLLLAGNWNTRCGKCRKTCIALSVALLIDGEESSEEVDARNMAAADQATEE